MLLFTSSKYVSKGLLKRYYTAPVLHITTQTSTVKTKALNGSNPRTQHVHWCVFALRRKRLEVGCMKQMENACSTTMYPGRLREGQTVEAKTTTERIKVGKIMKDEWREEQSWRKTGRKEQKRKAERSDRSSSKRRRLTRLILFVSHVVIHLISRGIHMITQRLIQ